MNRTRSGEILSGYINTLKRPRNQIATLSGLTNTYIRNLENGEIANVPRERLIALGVALNLGLSEMENLLEAFDRAVLTSDDVPAFIETAKSAKLSEAVLPIRDLFAYELIMLSLEITPGKLVIVNDRPTISLMARGHRTHSDRALLFKHGIYGELIEAIGDARRENFYARLVEHRIEHYICHQCLEDYLNANVDETERLWRARQVAALRDVLMTRDNFTLHMTDTCVHLNFSIKFTGSGSGNDKLSYSARAPHDVQRGKSGRLVGFISENPSLCECFKDELSRVAATVIRSLPDKKSQIEYLNALLAPMADALGEQIEDTAN